MSLGCHPKHFHYPPCRCMLLLRDTITVVEKKVLNRGSTSEWITLADRLAVTDDGVFEHGGDRLCRCLVRLSRKLESSSTTFQWKRFYTRGHAASMSPKDRNYLAVARCERGNMIGDIHVRWKACDAWTSCRMGWHTVAHAIECNNMSERMTMGCKHSAEANVRTPPCVPGLRTPTHSRSILELLELVEILLRRWACRRTPPCPPGLRLLCSRSTSAETRQWRRPRALTALFPALEISTPTVTYPWY